MSNTPAAPVRSITLDEKLKSLRSWVLLSLILRIIAGIAVLLTIAGKLGSIVILHTVPETWDLVLVIASMAAFLSFATAHASAKMEHAELVAEKYSLAGQYTLSR